MPRTFWWDNLRAANERTAPTTVYETTDAAFADDTYEVPSELALVAALANLQ